jgi:aminoglycoside phosphotransferase (APT) family kinase protein
VPRAHDMGREHRVLDALWPVFPPAPRPWHLCEDSRRDRGRLLRDGAAAGRGGAPPRCRRRGRRTRARAARWAKPWFDTMVALHAVDFARAGLGALGRPEGFMARQVRGWAERWVERARDREVPAIESLAAGSPRASPRPRPHPRPRRLKLDNMMVAADDTAARVVAVLDWEMCTTGGPARRPRYPPSATGLRGDPYARAEQWRLRDRAAGLPHPDEIVARYAALSGRDVSRIAFYESFARYKTAVVVQQIYIRWKRGQTRGRPLRTDGAAGGSARRLRAGARRAVGPLGIAAKQLDGCSARAAPHARRHQEGRAARSRHIGDEGHRRLGDEDAERGRRELGMHTTLSRMRIRPRSTTRRPGPARRGIATRSGAP